MTETKIRFPTSAPFLNELRKRVNTYFETEKLDPRDQPRMYLKTAVILLWVVACYLGLMFVASNAVEIVLFAVAMGLGMAGIGFDIQHDANHGGYSKRPAVNKALALTLDAVGGSSYVWSWKHNVIHHTYSNIAYVDADTDVGFFARLTPNHKRYAMHRFQHLYIWFLYGLLPFKWHFLDDFKDLWTGRIGTQSFPRPKPWTLAWTLGFKAFFYGWAIVLPLMTRPLGAFVLAYTVAALTLGLALAIVFQLAHCVPAAEFPMPNSENRMEKEFAIHQIETTVDFARDNRFVTWALGGLNFQVEHHLFPKICHVHYPAIARIVEQTCAEYGVKYRKHETFTEALAAHAKWLHAMGKADAPPQTVPAAELEAA